MEYIKEISPEQAVILWQESRLSLSKCYEKAPEILKVHGSVIGTLGNFSASIGKAKSKKTFNVSAIVAAALKNGTVLRYAAELPEEKRKVLYIDTEEPCRLSADFCTGDFSGSFGDAPVQEFPRCHHLLGGIVRELCLCGHRGFGSGRNAGRLDHCSG